jgi:hypothetical protein
VAHPLWALTAMVVAPTARTARFVVAHGARLLPPPYYFARALAEDGRELWSEEQLAAFANCETTTGLWWIHFNHILLEHYFDPDNASSLAEGDMLVLHLPTRHAQMEYVDNRFEPLPV